MRNGAHDQGGKGQDVSLEKSTFQFSELFHLKKIFLISRQTKLGTMLIRGINKY